MTDQLSLLPMLDDAEHPTWILNGKPGINKKRINAYNKEYYLRKKEGDEMMLCDELKAETVVPQGTSITLQMYGKGDVDAAIAELKSENERLNRELEHVKNGDCINTCDVVEKHVKEEIKAKRALWLARAECAKWQILYYLYKIYNKFKSRKFDEVERKCRVKAEEYK